MRLMARTHRVCLGRPEVTVWLSVCHRHPRRGPCARVPSSGTIWSILCGHVSREPILCKNIPALSLAGSSPSPLEGTRMRPIGGHRPGGRMGRHSKMVLAPKEAAGPRSRSCAASPVGVGRARTAPTCPPWALHAAASRAPEVPLSVGTVLGEHLSGYSTSSDDGRGSGPSSVGGFVWAVTRMQTGRTSCPGLPWPDGICAGLLGQEDDRGQGCSWDGRLSLAAAPAGPPCQHQPHRQRLCPTHSLEHRWELDRNRAHQASQALERAGGWSLDSRALPGAWRLYPWSQQPEAEQALPEHLRLPGRHQSHLDKAWASVAGWGPLWGHSAFHIGCSTGLTALSGLSRGKMILKESVSPHGDVSRSSVFPQPGRLFRRLSFISPWSTWRHI